MKVNLFWHLLTSKISWKLFDDSFINCICWSKIFDKSLFLFHLFHNCFSWILFLISPIEWFKKENLNITHYLRLWCSTVELIVLQILWWFLLKMCFLVAYVSDFFMKQCPSRLWRCVLVVKSWMRKIFSFRLDFKILSVLVYLGLVRVEFV